jgi:hypothetical protein
MEDERHAMARKRAVPLLCLFYPAGLRVSNADPEGRLYLSKGKAIGDSFNWAFLKNHGLRHKAHLLDSFIRNKDPIEPDWINWLIGLYETSEFHGIYGIGVL